MSESATRETGKPEGGEAARKVLEGKETGCCSSGCCGGSDDPK
jgi:hypothetical protein